MINHPFDARLDLVPVNPGVYLMKDASGSVIYVGKAVQLRSRLRSYFTANPQATGKIMAMISNIADFSYIVCENELEALILEANLIKQYQPRYNTLLRDDKGYPYLKVTMQEMYPRLVKAFRIGSDRQEGARYFGPYLAGDLYRALNALRHIFPTKTCRRVLPRDIGKERPCLNYYIGRCVGPCRGDVPVETYRQVMSDICRFLEGKYNGILVDLTRKMEEASNELSFEKAATFRDRIDALKRLMEKQKAVSAKESDADAIGIAGNGNEICLQKLEIREGRLIGASSYFFQDENQTDSELLEAFIGQHYPEIANIPPEIIIPAEISEQISMSAYLQRLRNGSCQIHRPQRGEKVRLIEMAEINAKESLQRHTLMGGRGQTAVQESLRLLSEKAAGGKMLHRIEAYDISNLGNDYMAGSMVVFNDGRPARQQYRQFKIKGQNTQDDYQAIREVLARRFQRIDDEKFGSRPDLILIDGGQTHVMTAVKLLKNEGLDIPVAGMVKNSKHRTRGLAVPDMGIIELNTKSFISASADSEYEYSQEDERLWRIADETARLDTDSDQQALNIGLLRLLTAIQDEAHRFAIQYQRKLAQKKQVRFSLEKIKGIGPARRRILLQKFGSIKAVSELSLKDLESVQGLGASAAREIFRYFHPHTQDIQGEK